MFDFLATYSITNTTALIALIILLVPIIIHLINPNKAKLLWIAHIQFIKTNDHKRVFQIKWLEKLILFLRLLMLVSISLILVKPIYLTELINISEEYHYVSSDWLSNTSVDELDKLDELIKSGDKLFLLEQPNKIQYENIEQMKLLVKKDDIGIKNRSTSQSEYIAELMHRTTLPERTHLYLTNRQNNYGNEILSSIGEQSSSHRLYKIHLHRLIESDKFPRISINIVSDENTKIESDLLVVALNAISIDSNVIFDIKRINRMTSLSEREMPDIVFQFFETKQHIIYNQFSDDNSLIDVITQPKGLVFKDADNAEIQWRYSEPVKLIGILSELVNRLEKISNDNTISEENILKNYFQSGSVISRAANEKKQNTPLYSKSLNSYLIFLFCLFFLIERYFVLSRDRHND